jgi:hypothetical protein
MLQSLHGLNQNKHLNDRVFSLCRPPYQIEQIDPAYARLLLLNEE